MDRRTHHHDDGEGEAFHCATPIAAIGSWRLSPASSRWRDEQQTALHGPLAGVPRVPFEFGRAGSPRVLGTQNTALLSNRDQVFERAPLADMRERGESTDWVWLAPELTAEVIGRHVAVDDVSSPFAAAGAHVSARVAAGLRLSVDRVMQRDEAEPLLVEETALCVMDAVGRGLSGRRGRGKRRSGSLSCVRRSTRLWHAEVVEVARRYLFEHAAESVSLADVGRAVHVSPAYLCRVFRAETGQSVHGFLIELRVARAVDRLASGGDGLTRVALSVGFSSGSHFSDVMARRLGVPPSRVRRAFAEPDGPEARTILDALRAGRAG